MPSMINWMSVLFNACWIVGLAILLASFSYTRWKRTIADTAVSPPSSGFLHLVVAYSLIGIGLIGTASSLWMAIVSAIAIVGIIILTVITHRAENAGSKS
ncbi:MAG: hypothetical protein M9928_10550 [Anaerolineae bacterium]|nr:hypothetical protein [Anaerolineae bacterium]MCO5190443.1 hypothetical protein [Anaerolineae bacterium]MCO5193211.1 hypothetical protein [Anaerolineae bacterium]MCO5198155.1 hypothetical protein [Anaerolineae bacterium]MCO5205462.1 hypothetical protein [Anaerolineae bacterium]